MLVEGVHLDAPHYKNGKGYQPGVMKIPKLVSCLKKGIALRLYDQFC